MDDLSAQSDEALAVTYQEMAASHGRWAAEGNHAEANARAEVIAGVYRELRGRGVDAQHRIIQFLDDGDESVRSWAGAHALEFAPERGEEVLVALADGRSLTALNARMTLREWRAGRLSFP